MMKRTTFLVNEKEFEQFKKKCKKNNSDTSKELRKFIENYIKGK